MQIGPLRHRLLIQAETTTPDDYGDRAKGWTDVCTLWCDAQPTTGFEKESLGAPRGVQRFTFTTRYYPGITAAHRCVFRGTIFDITSVVDVDSRRRTLEITAQAGLSRG